MGREDFYEFVYEVNSKREKTVVFTELKKMGYRWSGGSSIQPEIDCRRNAKYICATNEEGVNIIRYGTSLDGLRFGKIIKPKMKKNNVERYGGVVN